MTPRGEADPWSPRLNHALEAADRALRRRRRLQLLPAVAIALLWLAATICMAVALR